MEGGRGVGSALLGVSVAIVRIRLPGEPVLIEGLCQTEGRGWGDLAGIEVAPIEENAATVSISFEPVVLKVILKTGTVLQERSNLKPEIPHFSFPAVETGVSFRLPIL